VDLGVGGSRESEVWCLDVGRWIEFSRVRGSEGAYSVTSRILVRLVLYCYHANTAIMPKCYERNMCRYTKMWFVDVVVASPRIVAVKLGNPTLQEKKTTPDEG